MIKTAILISATAVAGITLPTIPVPVSAEASISYLNIEVNADGIDAKLNPTTSMGLDITFTGDRHIRIGA